MPETAAGPKMAQLKGAAFDCLFLARPTGARKRVHVTMRPGSDVVAAGLTSHRSYIKDVYSKILDVEYHNKEKQKNSVGQPQSTAVNDTPGNARWEEKVSEDDIPLSLLRFVANG